MPRKTRILFHLEQAGYGGTEKAILTFCENINKEDYEVFLFVRKQYTSIRKLRHYLLGKISRKRKHRYVTKYINSVARLPQFYDIVGADKVFIGDLRTFEKCLTDAAPDIVHFNRGNWEAFYDQACSVIPEDMAIVETNIFGVEPSTKYLNRLARVYFVSKWLLDKSSRWGSEKGRVLFNPIKTPASNSSLRSELSIPAGAFVLGRISRPDMVDDDLIIRVYRQISSANVYLLILAGSTVMESLSKADKKIICLPPTSSEEYLSRFYNTLDVLLHHRTEGETFGMNIAEAMIHGKPVISHTSKVDNAQLELLDDAEDGAVGYVSYKDSAGEYAGYIRQLMNDPVLLAELGTNAKKRSVRLYHERVVTNYLCKEYESILS